MEYKEFLTSLDVNAQADFHDKVPFETGMYKTRTNFAYELTIHGQSSPSFDDLCRLLKINEKHLVTGTQYVSRVPIQVKVEASYFKGRKDEVVQLAEFINNFLTVYEYFRNQFGLPRFVLDGRNIFKRVDSKWEALPYESLFNHDFYDIIKESIIHGEASTDLISAVAAEKEPFDIGWKVYLEAVRLFYSGDFRQALINCVTAIESEITKPVEKWITENTYTKDDAFGKLAIRDLGNPLKFEIYVNTINRAAFTPRYTNDELLTLISNFKQTNTLRNRIVHEGIAVTLVETKVALEMSGLFLRALWLQRHGM